MFARQAVNQVTTETLAAIADAIAQGIQRKQAEEEVRRSEAFLAAAQALSQTGSWGWNTRTGELSWSRETYRIFGLQPGVVPTLSTIREIVHADDRPLFDQDAEVLRHDRSDFEREYRLQMGDGTLKYVHSVGRSVGDTFPDLDFVGSIMDVTERRRAEEALLTAQARLEEVSRLTTMGELRRRLPMRSISHLPRSSPTPRHARNCSRLNRHRWKSCRVRSPTLLKLVNEPAT